MSIHKAAIQNHQAIKGLGWYFKNMQIIVITLIAISGLFFVANQGASLLSSAKDQITSLTTQAKDFLPGGDAHALGLAEGEKILNNSNYLDQINIALIPGATELIESIKNGQITEARISEIANLYFPVAALKAGILDISAENRAEFVRGVVEGYFPQ